MNASYNDFLERLKEERLARQLSQSQMGHILRMSQSHYSKAEQGTRRFTYYEIQYLCETGVDVYYIFTGYRCKQEYKEFFQKCTYRELECYMDIVCSALKCLCIKESPLYRGDLRKLLESIQCVMKPHGKDKTLFYTLRCTLNHSQIKMADLLGVDVKKLRDLEKGKVLPDSEMMWNLSQMYGISFAIVVNDANGLGCEIGYLLDQMEDGKREAVFEQIKAFHSILK